jgi:hypothetical protein
MTEEGRRSENNGKGAKKKREHEERGGGGKLKWRIKERETREKGKRAGKRRD